MEIFEENSALSCVMELKLIRLSPCDLLHEISLEAATIGNPMPHEDRHSRARPFTGKLTT